MNKVLEEFSKIGIIPVIALDNVEDAAPLAKALCDGSRRRSARPSRSRR